MQDTEIESFSCGTAGWSRANLNQLTKYMFTTCRNTLAVLLISLSAAVGSEENVSREVDVAPGDKLVVDVDFGTIQVAAGADGKVALEAHRKVEFGNEAKEKEYLA